jgi:hypothetical protein
MIGARSMDFIYGEYLISDNKDLLDLPTIKGFLARSYWANKRSDERIMKSIDSSIGFGIYKEEKQVGFARIVTDDSTMYWLCDVYICVFRKVLATHSGKYWSPIPESLSQSFRKVLVSHSGKS